MLYQITVDNIGLSGYTQSVATRRGEVRSGGSNAQGAGEMGVLSERKKLKSDRATL